MTDVEACAEEPELAYRVNAIGTQNVALACMACDASLAYVSTNEVFDGRARGAYREWDAINPINPYGGSKAAGEWFAQPSIETVLYHSNILALLSSKP